jgi:hypothetical protein
MMVVEKGKEGLGVCNQKVAGGLVVLWRGAWCTSGNWGRRGGGGGD